MSEINQEKFQEWLEGEVPYYKNLNQEEIAKLKDLYKEVDDYERITSNIMDLAHHHNTYNIDYGNDYQKASNELGRARANVSAYKEKLSLKYDKDDFENNKEIDAEKSEYEKRQNEWRERLKWEEDKKNEEFRMWLDENFSYSKELTEEEISELKYLKEKVDAYEEIPKNIMDLAMHHNTSGIDYDNDLRKAMNDLAWYRNNMNEYRKKLDTLHGVAQKEDTKFFQ